MYKQDDILNLVTDQSMGKIEDAGTLVHHGRIDQHWGSIKPESYRLVGDKLRNDTWSMDSNLAVREFGLRSLEFGNWMTQQNRADFMYASMQSLNHLAKLFKVEQSAIGFYGKLSVALGARGRGGRAMAHYEPNPYSVINLTKTMGQGTLAHEYGHALDNILSFHTGKKAQTYVSGGRTTRMHYDKEVAKNGNYFEQQFEELFRVLYWDNKGNATDFQNNIKKVDRDYWKQRNEVFARTFEAYVRMNLNKTNIKDIWLCMPSYKNKVYPSDTLVKKASKYIDNIVRKSYELFKKNKGQLFGIGNKELIKSGADLDDTLEHIAHIVYREYKTVKELAFELKGRSVGETSENIWNYIRLNIQYQLDKDGLEELRTPNRTIRDGIGDCDDFTILTSCILMNLGIPHELRIAAYEQKGVFQHIYIASIDQTGNTYIIDAVPDIPHFNYEEPYIDIKTINMDLVELSGLGATGASNLEQEQQRELIEELNAPFTLSGVEFDDDQDLEDHFLDGFEVVDSEDEADIIVSSSEIPNLIDKGILAEVNKARLALIKEQDNPSFLSKTINVPKELSLLNRLMESWDDESRDDVIAQGIQSNSDYANFYKSIKLGLDQLAQEEGLEGFGEDVYLAQITMDELLEDDDEDLSGRAERRARRAQRKADRKAGKRGIKKLVKKVGKGVKKAVKAVVRYNPATIAMRGAIITILKLNMFKYAEKLITGYLSESEARSAGIDMANYQRAKEALAKSIKFFTNIGGKSEKFKKAIVRGRAAKKTVITVNGLGAAVAAGATAAATPFIVKVGQWLKKVATAPVRLVKKLRNKKGGGDLVETGSALLDASGDPMDTAMMPMDDEFSEAGFDMPMDDSSSGKLKAFFTTHKKKIIIGGSVVVITIVGLFIFKKMKDKKKRRLAGLKAARTRKRNAKKPSKRLSGTRRKSTSKAVGYLPAPKVKRASSKRKTTPTRKRKASTVGSAKKANANRLAKMHQVAKRLRKQHPNTKYSTLLKKAAKQI